MIQGVSPTQLSFIIKAIQKYFPKAKIYAFGSRVQNTSKKYSDFDICIDNGKELDLVGLAFVKEILENSEIPFIVDISDYHAITREFRANVIDKDALDITSYKMP